MVYWSLHSLTLDYSYKDTFVFIIFSIISKDKEGSNDWLTLLSLDRGFNCIYYPDTVLGSKMQCSYCITMFPVIETSNKEAEPTGVARVCSTNISRQWAKSLEVRLRAGSRDEWRVGESSRVAPHSINIQTYYRIFVMNYFVSNL